MLPPRAKGHLWAGGQGGQGEARVLTKPRGSLPRPLSFDSGASLGGVTISVLSAQKSRNKAPSNALGLSLCPPPVFGSC